MKFALLSDIHSNVFALEAVIQDAQHNGVDHMINLGDILYGPIAPKETYDLLMQHEMITISGNQDRQIVEATETEMALNPTMKFIVDDLGPKPIAWLQALPFDMQFNDDVYLCHGTPQSDLIYLLENVEFGYARLRADNEIISLLNGQTTNLICCGHTHTPRTVKLSTGQTIVNPGSVGLQAYTDNLPVVHSMENFNTMASYSIVELNRGSWQIKHINVPYDIEPAIEACQQRNRTDWVHFIKTGRCL
ncbi:metallophosphoesterase family protein [Thalassotalea sp. PLHSN55]|uniref:metallophosphoesterase family protein n=1 Tax=Thalassotalea sp. PLHSN55 TaxID=3435888 RepID=UPI003F833BFE